MKKVIVFRYEQRRIEIDVKQERYDSGGSKMGVGGWGWGVFRIPFGFVNLFF